MLEIGAVLFVKLLKKWILSFLALATLFEDENVVSLLNRDRIPMVMAALLCPCFGL